MELFVIWGVIAAKPLSKVSMSTGCFVTVDLIHIVVIDSEFNQ